jgi:hypothetical protein
MGGDALEAVRHSLCQKKDGHLGYRLLSDIGVIPTQKDSQVQLAQPILPEKSQEERVMGIVMRLMESARERAQIFGMPMAEMPMALEKVCRQLNLTNGTENQFWPR